MKDNNGFKGGRVGEKLALLLKSNPDEVVIVHHIWNYPNKALLQIERRDKNQENCKFERVEW